MREHECFDCGTGIDIALYTSDSYSLILCDDCAERDYYYDELRDVPSNAVRTELEV